MRLGVFQPEAGGASLPARCAMLEDAVTDRALDLVVCPELFATGYHIAGAHADLAEPADGAYFAAFSALARRTRTAIVFGYPEAADGGAYNAAMLIGADGRALANHRKQLPSPGSFEVRAFANGQGVTVVPFAGLRLAIAICYEVEFPETARAVAQAGADLLVVPTALVDQWGVVAERLVPTRAFENGLWLAYANHAGQEMGQGYLGGSRIVAPDGQEVAVAGPKAALITAEVDRARVDRARERLPYLTDVTRLTGGD